MFIILLLFITFGVVWLWPSAMTIVDYYHYDDDDLLEKWFPLHGERAHSSYFRCFQKQNREEGETE